MESLQNTYQQSEGNLALAARPGKYLTFNLATEQYGLDILKIQEIVGMLKVTRVPRTPVFIRGVVNLRGKVIPVVDLRLKFGMEGVQDTEKTCIIVTQIHRNSQQVTMGIIVDEVSEVIDIASDQLENPPEFGGDVNTQFLIGLGKIGQKVVMLLDVDKVLSGEELSIVNQCGDV